MELVRHWNDAIEVAGAPGVRRLLVQRESWRPLLLELAQARGRLLALWAENCEDESGEVSAAVHWQSGVLVAVLQLANDAPSYPGIEDLFSAASRMQRAAADLTGINSTDSDRRPWLRHSAWAADDPPLANAGASLPASTPSIDDYSFVRVEGEGVHEVPVGPVHAGIIEPGHFRFSIVGEKVLKLEQRLGYVHKGIERRFTEMSVLEGHRLAARISGDAAVAYSWAYCQAVEGCADVTVPPRAAWLRALGLELERCANHLGDLGALGNDAGFAFLLAQFSRLKEMLLRVTKNALGQRYLLDFVVPGGTKVDLSPENSNEMHRCMTMLMEECAELRAIGDEHAGVRDRFKGAGAVATQLAGQLGLTGLAGRASGQAYDLRVDLPCKPYDRLGVKKCGHTEGDVLARVTVRFDELHESCRLIQRILHTLPAGSHHNPVKFPARGGHSIGLIESWRGPVLIALHTTEEGRIKRCHAHDPSWQNWPVLEHAIIGNIVPDFPLINKSFNLSYSGHDL